VDRSRKQRKPVRHAAGLLLAVVWVTSCRSAPPPAHPQRWAKAWINSLNSQRLVQVSPLLGDPGTYTDPGSGGPLSGEWLAYYFANQWRVYPQLHYELRQVTGDAETVAVEWQATGFGAQHAAPIDGIFILQLRNGMIASVRGYYDVGKILKAR
jgi:SnoaL-like protein